MDHVAMTKDSKLIIANCSGFFGDRFSAAKEMVQGGKIDVLTGDYLAELTMALLVRKKMSDSNLGYAGSFLKQMEEVMGECLDKRIRVVTNAGGLNPQSLAHALEALGQKLGLHPKIAYIGGDDILERLDELQGKGEVFSHMDNGMPLQDCQGTPITANAYWGGWGIAEALKRGADIVIGGRIADASLVVGPAAWHFGWKQTDWDKLAGAVVAGHIIECGPQATGGNYSFFQEVRTFRDIGFPIAEINNDGSFVITKHPGTGGLVSVGTVTAQLLYEIREPGYITPDVIARFDTIDISEEGPDRVLITGVQGEPPPDKLKVCINNLKGYQNTMTFVLTGLDIEEKAGVVEKTLFESLEGKKEFSEVDVQLVRADKADPPTNEESFAYLRISVMDQDRDRVGRTFSSKVVELVISNVPGLNVTTPPTDAKPAIAHWPALVSARYVPQKVFVNGESLTIESSATHCADVEYRTVKKDTPQPLGGKSKVVPFGRLFGTRSGDKGGNANLGVWAKEPEAFAFLRKFLTKEKLEELLPDLHGYEIERYELPNILALNFYIKGFLGEGVAASFRMDPQAKTLGEYLRVKVISVPVEILANLPK